MYARRMPPEEPPCAACRIDPVEENGDALRIFFIVQNQFVMGFNGPVSINQLAIHEAIRLYEVADHQGCFEGVLRLGRWWIEKMRER